MESGNLLKRVLVGRALRTDRLNDTLLPRRLGLPVFASDALSSVAYAVDEIVLTLALAGGAAIYLHSWEVGVGVALVMLVIVASYRQAVYAYPGGGGDYEVTRRNLGPAAGVTVGSALIVDYILTVAVSVSAGVQNAAAALEFLRGYESAVAAGLIALLTLLNLRGVRESGRALAVPVYAFLGSIALLIVVGVVQQVTGTLGQAASARYELLPAEGYGELTTLGLIFLLLRSFASGSVALTGVQGVANGVPALRRPKSRNAASILAVMAAISITITVSVLWLTRASGIQIAADPAQLRLDGQPVSEDLVQDTVLGQLSKVVFGTGSFGVLLVAITTGVMLFVAANTAFNGFPVLASRLARDRFLPRGLVSRGQRLAYSNGILLLAGASVALVLVYRATVTELIQMYIVGVFISFTVSQIGLVRHWNRQLRTELSVRQRVGMIRSRTINQVGATVSALVLAVVVLTRFTHGAGLSLLGIGLIGMGMTMVYRYHRTMDQEISLADEGVDASQVVPSRVHALVYVARLDRPTMRALAYARATRPPTLEAVTVDVVPEATALLREQWTERELPITLRTLDSPYRESVRPVLDYVRRVRRDRPRDVVVVYVAEYVGREGWWVRFIRDRTLERLRRGLLRQPGVMLVIVPWQGAGLEQAEQAAGEVDA